MDCHTTWTETEESRLQREDEVRMQELKRLFDLMDEQELEQKTLGVKLERALRILSWDDFTDIDVCPGLAELEVQQPIETIKQHRKWLKAFRSAMPYLAKVLPVNDASLLIRLRSILDRYAEISYPNLLIVIQPKLQTLNAIEA